ncbi:hypothetical protein [Halopseudomonas xinjiangensis]|uniref:hypothetical protein n=1 Tax=Halopseudomonas xinjiangensis TaxID=487184 RepID=UPI0012FE2BB6|nr:hypothetical protein [Halopseudomonas xinjiangensis]
MLELAAKAYGIGPVIGFEDGQLVIGPIRQRRYWGPLNQDGDAARLAAKLNMDVSFRGEGDERVVQVNDTIMFVNSDLACGNEMKAYREAVVSVAAEIGRLL